MKGDITRLMFIKLYLKFLLQKRCYTASHLVFLVKQDTDVFRERIADLLSLLDTPDRKIKMICHRKKDRTVNLAEFLLCFSEHFIRKFQTYRRN